MQKTQRHRFSLTTFPDAVHLNAAVVFLAIGVAACFFLPFMIPELNRDGPVLKQINRVPLFELTNEIQAGQFRLTPHEGDTKPSMDATFWAVSILSNPRAQGLTYNKEKTKEYVQQLESVDFGQNVEGIYEGISLSKRLGLLDNKITDKYYSKVLQLVEPNSGFRYDMSESASIRATFLAFETMRELGRFNQFQQTDQWNSSMQFVNALKMEGSNAVGFANRNGENATLEATYYALRILPKNSVYGAENLVYLCQGADGGFHYQPLETLTKLYQYQSPVVSTVYGISILELSGVWDSRSAMAKNYLRSQLLFNELGVQSIFEVLNLMDTFDVYLSAPSFIPAVIQSVGAFCMFAALLAFYRPQLPEDSFSGAYSKLFTILIYLGVAAILTRVSGSLTLIGYSALSFYLIAEYYSTQSSDNNDGEMLLVSVVNSVVFLTVAIAFSSMYPFVFASASIYYVLLAWTGVSAFVAAFGANYFTTKQKISFYVKAGFLGWVSNTLILYSILAGRPDLGFVFRLIETRNIWPLVLVGYPVTSLGMSYFGSAVGYLLFNSK